MLKNITIGQYFPGESLIHRIDPRMKLVVTMLYIIMLFFARNIIAVGVAALLVVVAYFISKVPLHMALKGIKSILFVVIITAVFNMLFVDGDVLFQIWKLKITVQGVATAIVMSSRIIVLLLSTSLLTYTTSPIALTDAIEDLFSPLQKLGAPVHEIAMMMTIAMRFIPTLIEETDKLMSAQKARGADMESGNMLQRIQALLPILVPLFISAFRRADELALAMESRCYHGGEGRTRMRQMHIRFSDIVVLFITCGTFAGVLMANRILFLNMA